MSIDRELLARNLRAARENRGLTQQAAAKKLKFSRSLVAQIELANRPVTDDELAEFASVYGTTVVELKGASISNEADPMSAALQAAVPETWSDALHMRMHTVEGALLQAAHLERVLGRPMTPGPVIYQLSSPRNLAEAIAQGEHVADQERVRIGLRDGPLTAIPALLATQAVRTFAVDLPVRLSAVFAQHPSAGCAIVVNSNLDATRRRFHMVHAYAHALLEPAGALRVCRQANSNDLLERRASAFAEAFLLPSSGVAEAMRRIAKGRGSRTTFWTHDPATERSVRSEERAEPGSQTITYADVAWIARRFGTSYPLTVSRLLASGVLSESDAKALLRSRTLAVASAYMVALDPGIPRSDSSEEVAELSDLNAEILHLAIEAYRRGLITKAELLVEAVSLKIPGLSDAKLLEFADAAR